MRAILFAAFFPLAAAAPDAIASLSTLTKPEEYAIEVTWVTPACSGCTVGGARAPDRRPNCVRRGGSHPRNARRVA